MFACHFRRSDSHAVVVGVNKIHILSHAKNRVYCDHGLFFVPVAVECGDEISSTFGEFFAESVVSPFSGR